MSAQHVPVRPSSCLSYISCPMCLCLYPWPFLHTSLPDINKGRPHSGPSLFYAYFHLIYHNFCRYLFSTFLCFYEPETALFRLYSSITATISLLFWMLFCSSASSTLWSGSGVTIFNGSKLYSKSFRDVLPITNTSLSTDNIVLPHCTSPEKSMSPCTLPDLESFFSIYSHTVSAALEAIAPSAAI